MSGVALITTWRGVGRRPEKAVGTVNASGRSPSELGRTDDREGDDRAISSGSTLAESLRVAQAEVTRGRRLARLEANPDLAELHRVVLGAFAHAVPIVQATRWDNALSPAQFASQFVRLDAYGDAVDEVVRARGSIDRWPRAPGTVMAHCVGESALEVAMQFSKSVRNGVTYALGYTKSHGQYPAVVGNRVISEPHVDPEIAKWFDAAKVELTTHTLLPPEVWPGWELNRDVQRLQSLMNEEHRRAPAQDRAATELDAVAGRTLEWLNQKLVAGLLPATWHGHVVLCGTLSELLARCYLRTGTDDIQRRIDEWREELLASLGLVQSGPTGYYEDLMRRLEHADMLSCPWWPMIRLPAEFAGDAHRVRRLVKALEGIRGPIPSSNEVASDRPAPEPWVPPAGFVGSKKITSDARFRKHGKSPPRTTIDAWTKSHPPDQVERAPDSGEIFFPEEWVLARIAEWSPRPPTSRPS